MAREAPERLGRHLDWDGAHNARDLGGLRVAGGRETRRGALVRSACLDRLSRAGWDALEAHGVRTIVDLRNEDEREPDLEPRPAGLTTLQVPLDDVADSAFWNRCHADELDGTPLYYRPFIERKPERCAAAVGAIAHAQPGGVLIHCVGGRDRTGLVSLLVLALLGVAPETIAADYELSNTRLPPFWAERGMEDQRAAIRAVLDRHGTSARTALLDLLGSLDAAAGLRAGGLSAADLDALKDRLLSA